MVTLLHGYPIIRKFLVTLKRLSFFFLLIHVTACWDSVPLDERFYRTWVDPSGGTEPVVFRKDGTVSWFGEEGTFDTYHPLVVWHQGLEVSVSGNTVSSIGLDSLMKRERGEQS